MIEVRIKRISEKFPDIPLPDYATDGSSGIDIRACIDEPITIEPMETKLIPTNLIFEIPNGYEGQVRPRSGLAIKNFIGILNTPGTIDSDYRGELKIILTNFGKENFTVNRGDRIAQLVFAKTERAIIKEADSLTETKRNSGGFGHTGVK